jgi:hypothetical protein
MSAAENRKVVLVTRPTRLAELVARYKTLGQAKFYLEHLAADLSDYLRENEAYASSLRVIVEALQAWGRYQIIDRAHPPNYIFAADDIVVTLGQDGMVANTLKYLNGQPLIGVNPNPNAGTACCCRSSRQKWARCCPGWPRTAAPPRWSPWPRQYSLTGRR